MRNRKSIFTLLVVLTLSIATSSFADNRAVLNKVAAFFHRYRSIQAAFSVTDGSNVLMRGLFRYSNPGKIRVDLAEPAGKKIISNGRYLFVVNQNNNTVGRQNLYGRALSGGLGFLKYYSNVAVLSSSSGYLLRLKSKTAGWRQVNIRADKNYIPLVISLRDAHGNTRKITLSNVKVGISFPGRLFDFRVPGNTQMVENPLNLK